MIYEVLYFDIQNRCLVPTILHLLFNQNAIGTHNSKEFVFFIKTYNILKS